ncbi:hypothetical protein DFJ63DRAFT_320244 [Scheffersomyces coipomensis]|uniref:uncharacterized protein n=1 Tax=Scheffersomyces coipomensis TaxID=1788519 RepID=UPI00315CA3EA
MTSLSYFINCQKYIDFYKKNHEKRINLFVILNDPAISNPYFEDLTKLELILEDVNIQDNSEILNDIKKIIVPWEQYKYKFKELIIVLYKVLNSHFIIQDCTESDVALMKVSNDIYIRILNKELEKEFKDPEKVSEAFNFKRYTLDMKTLTVKWEINKKLTSMKSNISSRSSLSTTNKRASFNDTAQKYDVNNLFFNKYGYFYPQSKFDLRYTSFMESNLELMNIRPCTIPHTPYSSIDTVSVEKEIHIEMVLLSLLKVAGKLFTSHGIEFKNQTTLKLSTDEDSIMKGIPNIVISLKGDVNIPLEIKQQDVKKIYESFVISSQKNNHGSREFVELFSQGLYESILCRSNCFLITDSLYCIGVVIESYPLPSFDISNLHGIPCKIIVFDSKNEILSLPLFIILFVLKYSKRLEESKKDDFLSSLVLTDDQISYSRSKRYKLLSTFQKLLLNVPDNVDLNVRQTDLMTSARSRDSANQMLDNKQENSVDGEETGVSDTEMDTIDDFIDAYAGRSPGETNDNDDEDIEDVTSPNSSSIRFPDDSLSAIHAVEERIFSKLDIEVSLNNYCILINSMNFAVIDYSELNIHSIISGAYPQRNYSIIVKDQFQVIKIFDPIRCRVDVTGNFISFQDRLKYTFKCFVREALVHNYLNDTFQSKPRCYGVGLLINENSDVAPQNINSTAGFFIRMEYCQGLPLDKLNWNKQMKTELWTIINRLHELGASHGDIHASNFLYDTDNNSMVILDFGRSYQAYLRGNAGNQKKGMDISELNKRIEFDNCNTELMICKLIHLTRSHR